MSYQSVGKPKFYIDYLSYFASIGMIEEINPSSNLSVSGNFIGLDPTSLNMMQLSQSSSSNYSLTVLFKEHIHRDLMESINYWGLIGHSFHKKYPFNNNIQMMTRLDTKRHDISGNDKHYGGTMKPIGDDEEIINFDFDLQYGISGSKSFSKFPENGFSLTECSFSCNEDELLGWNDGFEGIKQVTLTPRFFDTTTSTFVTNPETTPYPIMLNCLTFGHTYTMPHSPNLEIKMETEYDGFDQKDTIGGSTFTNVRYTGAPLWGGVQNPWEIGTKGVTNNNSFHIKRAGRRNWSLKFSYLSENDLFASNYSSNTWLNEFDSSNNYDPYNSNSDVMDGDKFIYTLADDNSFDAKVMNFIGNGSRFLFQPDSNSSNPSDFAICVLDQDSLSIKQVANRTYDISLKIREVW